MRALLDVNVLVALLDTAHIHHRDARNWLVAHAGDGWASCPLTQNGCVRVMASASYPSPRPVGAVVTRLAAATAHPSHAFWPDDCSLLDDRAVDVSRVHGSRQVTDVYLLALAVRHAGRLVTFDARISLTAVHGARADHVLVL